MIIIPAKQARNDSVKTFVVRQSAFGRLIYVQISHMLSLHSDFTIWNEEFFFHWKISNFQIQILEL